MNIVLMTLRTARPTRTVDMSAVAKPFWIRKGYSAMTFFGTIITHTTQEAEALNACRSLTRQSKNDTHFDSLKNHEMIHLYQARSTHDSWLCFYIRYLYYWLSASRYCRRLRNAGYRLNPFEMEAYRHMHNPDYLTDRQAATEWRQYARMSLRDRLTLLRTAITVSAR